MGAHRKSLFLTQEPKNGYLFHKEDKFKMVSCPVNGIYCKDHILPQINELYAESELARINKEYQNAVELLQKAYYKTLELTESPCGKCVEMFQGSINQTLENMQEELYEMSFGIFHKKRYQQAYAKLNNFMRKIRLFKIGEVDIFATRKVSG